MRPCGDTKALDCRRYILVADQKMLIMTLVQRKLSRIIELFIELREQKTVIPGEDNIPVSICGARPVYNLTNDDVGYRLRFETKRVSSATSHTSTPSESEVEVHESVEISPPFVHSSPVLYVNGIERTGNTVSKMIKM